VTAIVKPENCGPLFCGHVGHTQPILSEADSGRLFDNAEVALGSEPPSIGSTEVNVPSERALRRIDKVDTLEYTPYRRKGCCFMKVQMVKWGNSFAVRIPKPVVEQAKLKEGDSLEIEAAAEGRLELRRASKMPTLAQLVAQITPENRYSEISTGEEVGKEVVEW
jgi:antitoxin MazE